MTDEVYVGVDGGGSKTAAVAADRRGRIVGRGRAGGSNYRLSGLETAARNVRAAVRAAAGNRPVARAVLALASCDLPEDEERLRSQLADVAREVRLENDSEAVLYAAFPAGEGVAAIAGTHANVLAALSGQRRRRFGLGYETGNLGGAIDVWRMALHHAFRSVEGSLPRDPALEAFILAVHDMPDFTALARAFRDRPLGHGDHPLRPAGVAAMPAFFELLPASPLARRALHTVAAEHAEAAAHLAHAVGFAPERPLPLALTGGLMTGRSPYRAAFLGRLRLTYPYVAPVSVARPELGALAQAHPDGGRHLDRWRRELEQSESA
jgi:hypothetical protein